ncbi:unnamed protein product [Euphydryas editha]|uniref:Uncharacterized protein n=1 Tax=Euphydryas editha TaxID=104508 RepID=A0AAU9V650_EUPED|nr:unnamed protein product [Euphydryas editha]
MESLSNIEWEEFYKITDTNEAAAFLIQKLKTTVEKYQYIRKIPSRRRPLKPWITAGLIRSIRNRNKLHKILKRSPDDESIKEHYTNYRNLFNKLIKIVKKKYYETQFAKFSVK